MKQLGAVWVVWMIAILLLVGCRAGDDSEEPASASSPSSATHETSGEVTIRLAADIPSTMERARIPGLQIALIADGEVVWEEGFGVVNAEGDEPVTVDTVFEAASLTKPVFAYAVMKMVDRGEIDLDTPIMDRLPTEKLEGFLGHSIDTEGYRHDQMQTITPRQVLSHSAGMAHGYRADVYTFTFEPGTDWKYSSDGYRLLQLLVEHIDGRTLGEVVESFVLEPLAMSSSSLVWRDDFEAVMAHGHSLFGRPSGIRRWDDASSASGLFTTAGDYARFVVAVVAGEGLKQETAREMLGWVVDMNDGDSLGWSLGFGLQRHQERVALWQWGDEEIFRNYVIASIDGRDGVVYLTNSFNGLSVCSDVVEGATGLPALGCLDRGYQPADGPYYEFFWAVEKEGPNSVLPRLADLVDGDPELFDADRVSGIAWILEGEGMAAEAAEVHRFNLDRNPDNGKMMIRAARAGILADEFEGAGELLRSAAKASEEPASPTDVAWLTDYLKAMENPVRLDHASMSVIAGDYGPRHIRVVDGELVYMRAGTGVSAHRSLRAVSADTLFIAGVTNFKLRVEFDGNGRPTKLVGLYQGGSPDESLRDD